MYDHAWHPFENYVDFLVSVTLIYSFREFRELYYLGTSQYLWEYETEKFATDHRLFHDFLSDGAPGYFVGWVHGPPVILVPILTGIQIISAYQSTGPLIIFIISAVKPRGPFKFLSSCDTGQPVLCQGILNRAISNFWGWWFGATGILALPFQRGQCKFWYQRPFISRERGA